MVVREQVVDFFQQLECGSSIDRVLASVSGGVDSMVLLHVLNRIKDELDLEIGVAHLDHCIRGEESRKDARFVREQAEELGLDFFFRRVNVGEVTKEKSLSEEAAARKVRYRFLREIADDQDFDFVALGHNEDDQVETILMHLLRGAGIDGLGGMEPRRGRFVRPLLSCDGENILNYAEREGVSYRVDRTNYDTSYLRNHLRHELIPSLQKQYNPKFKDALVRMGNIIREANDLHQSLIEKKWPRILRDREKEFIALDVPSLESLHPFLRKIALRHAVRKIKGDLRDISYSHVRDILEIAEGEGTFPHYLDLPGDLQVRLSGSQIEIKKGEFTDSGKSDLEYSVEPEGSFRYPELGWQFRFHIKDFDPDLSDTRFPQEPTHEFVDWNKVVSPLIIRNRRPGDKFQPLGMEGKKKLKDFFIDEKIPYSKRDSIPLVCSGSDIIWVVGERIDHRYRVTETTSEVLKMRANRI